VTDQNLIQEEIKGRLNSGNASYHSVQNLLSLHLLSKNAKIRKCKILILPAVWYGCETWSVILREEHRLKVFHNGVLRKVLGLKRSEVTIAWRKVHNEELHNLYSSSSIIKMMKSRRMRWAGNIARMRRRGMHRGYWWDSHKERDHWENQDVCGWIILKWILERYDKYYISNT
jgi:reverse gyrase